MLSVWVINTVAFYPKATNVKVNGWSSDLLPFCRPSRLHYSDLFMDKKFDVELTAAETVQDSHPIPF